MSKPQVIDLFCGAGGAARGLQQAGFHVTGVDIKPQPRYAGDVFIQADALTFPLDGFDLIWASPPCQRYSLAAGRNSRRARASHPDLIPQTRSRLVCNGALYCIENVMQAPLKTTVVLDGTMFPHGTHRTLRRRRFESNFAILSLSPLRSFGPCTCPKAVTVAGHPGTTFSRYYRKAGPGLAGNTAVVRQGYRGRAGTLPEWKQAMGIDWMTGKEIAQAIPPAYSEWIGRYALIALGLATA